VQPHDRVAVGLVGRDAAAAVGDQLLDQLGPEALSSFSTTLASKRFCCSRLRVGYSSRKHCRFGPEPVSGSAFRAAVSDWQRPEEPFAGAGPMVRIRFPPPKRQRTFGPRAAELDPEAPIRPLGFWQIRESNSRCSPADPSGKVPDTHSVDSICDHDFGVFTVTNIATENTDAVLPAHPLPRTPTAANQGLHRCRGARVPLTCLAPLAAWQSLCTGHVDASLENSVALAFTDGDRPSPAADTSVSLASERSSLARHRGQLVNRRKRLTLGQDSGTH
jgi:hypothetical protein